MKYLAHTFIYISLFLLIGCAPNDPNKSADGTDVIERNTNLDSSLPVGQNYRDTTYTTNRNA